MRKIEWELPLLLPIQSKEMYVIHPPSIYLINIFQFDKITDADIAAAEAAAYMEQSVDSLEMGETQRHMQV